MNRSSRTRRCAVAPFSLEAHLELRIELSDPDPSYRTRPIRRSSIPPRSASRSMGEGAHDRVELVGRSAQGLQRSRGWIATSTGAGTGDVRGQAPTGFEWIRSIGPLASGEVADASVGTTSTSRRAATTRARTRSSRRSPAGFHGVPRERGRPELVGDADLPFRSDEELAAFSTSSSRASTASARPSRPASIPRRRPLPRGSRAPRRPPAPRIARAVRTTFDARRTQRRSASPAASTARRSPREPTTSSTRPTPGRRPRGSARRL